MGVVRGSVDSVDSVAIFILAWRAWLGVPQPNAAAFGPLTSESRLADGQTGPYSIANHTPLALTEGNHSR